MSLRALAIVFAGLLVVGCLSGGDTPEPRATTPPATPEAAATPAPPRTVIPTVTVTPPPTVIPTVTVTPPPTGTAAPTVTPSPTGTAAPTGTVTPPPTGTAAPTGTVTPPPTGTAAPTGTPSPAAAETPSPTATAGPALLASFGDGTQLVGSEIAPGRYRASSPPADCRWRVQWSDESSWSNREGFGTIVDIEPWYDSIVSRGCGTWSNDLTPTVTPGEPFGDGTFLVGPEIAPGRYRAAAPTASCWWMRIEIEDDFGPFSRGGAGGYYADLPRLPVVDIGSMDSGFVSSGCGMWTADPAPITAPAQSFGDGTFLVGAEVSPGRYRTTSTLDGCEWEIRWLTGPERFSVDGHRTVIDVEPSHALVTSSGCGAWTTDLTPIVAPGEPFGDGTFLVGAEIAPGRYRTTSASIDCAWEISRMTRYVSTIGGHRTIVDIEPSLTSFTSSGCGVWSMDLTPLITPGEPFGDGLYLIGSEIAPGRYRTTSATDDCEWAMFRSAFGPDSRSTDGTFATGRSLTVVDISDRDIGFSSSGCGEWTADLTPIVTPGEPFGGGTFLVGSEVAPGRYYATSALDSCRWAFMFDFTRTLSSTERGTLPIVDVEPSHAGFASAGCGTWSTDPGPRTEAGRTFGDGVFLVGPEVAPGRYRAVSPSDECEWRRLRRFGGSVGGRPDDYIIGFGGSFIPFVDIAPTDAGFVSTGCGTWSADLTPRIVPGRPFGAGTYLVGPEVAPGRYRASSSTEACQWWRISGFSGEYFNNGDVQWLEDITDGGYVEEGAAIAEIAPSDAAFVSYGCGEWTTDFTARATPGQPFGGGTFLVGSEIAPGRYRTAPQSDRTCHWRRLSGFSGFRSSHLGYQSVESGSGHAIVDIAPSDVGFSSRGCGIWFVDRGSGHLPRTSFGEGTFVVGSGVPPGRYRARSAESWCTWRRLSGFGGSEDDIIAAVSADRGFGATIVDVAASDAGFYSRGCGTWSNDLEPTRSPGGSFSDGTHLVGSEIEPGRYQASETAGCTWRRLGGFDGSDHDLIEFGRIGTRNDTAIVEIAPSDVGFFSFGCGGWSPVAASDAVPEPVRMPPAPSATPAPQPSPSTRVGDGTHRVGTDMPSGRYRAASPTDACAWALRRGASGRGDARVAVTILDIEPWDGEFSTSGCGTWTNDLAPVVLPGQPFGDGTYFVGSEIGPGRYRASDPASCHWIRLTSFGGFSRAGGAMQVRYGPGGGPGIVDIAASDAGFYSRNCGTWAPVP